MSSITGSRHNCEQGQPKPQLRGVHSPPQQRNHRGGAGKGTTGPTPQGGRGGYHGVGGGGGGVWQPCIIHTCLHAYMNACYLYTSKDTSMHTCVHTYIHTYIHTCIHAYMHARMHACIHAYTHTQTSTTEYALRDCGPLVREPFFLLSVTDIPCSFISLTDIPCSRVVGVSDCIGALNP